MSSDLKEESLPSLGTGASSNHQSASDLANSVKHPLETSWTLFYKDPDVPAKNWKDAVKEVLAFDTVEDFWALYHHITQFSQLKKGSDYSLFRGGLRDLKSIRPEWEDPQNKHGGTWKFNFNKGTHPGLLDTLFQELLMTCVGEMYGEVSDSVNGIVAATRGNQYRFELWTRDCDEQRSRQIGDKLLNIIPAGHKIALEFVTNTEAERVSKARGLNPRAQLSLYKQ